MSADDLFLYVDWTNLCDLGIVLRRENIQSSVIIMRVRKIAKRDH